MNAISPEDEFLIVAKKEGQPDRSWTRSTLSAAAHIAYQALDTLDYTHASVVNTYGGHISNPIYLYEVVDGRITGGRQPES